MRQPTAIPLRPKSAVASVASAPDDMQTRFRSFRADYSKNGGLHLTSLPETEQEAVRVVSLYGPVKTYGAPAGATPDGAALVFTGDAASEEGAKRILAAAPNPGASPKWKYLLFSAHGWADTHNGMLSCLALSTPPDGSAEDGFLQAQEVMNLDLDTDLVALSACETGLGRLQGGEGLVGLGAAFIYAGAESVCASLWQVPSGPTTQLIPEMFRQLRTAGLDKAEALGLAQLQVMRKGQDPSGRAADYSAASCWAVFVLMGEYR